MAILDLDTDALRASVTVAEQANNEITQAMNLLNQIVVHEDWVCKERDNIKNYTLTNRQRVQELQAHSSAFYSAIKQSSERFDQAEQSMIQRVNQMDGLLSQIHNVVPTLGAGGISIASFGNLNNSTEG